MKKSVLLPTDENLILTIREDALDRNADLNSFCQLLLHLMVGGVVVKRFL